MPLTIIAHIHAETGQEDLVQAELEKLVAPTRSEAGCLQYDLHQDNQTPGHFLFVEAWESRDLWQTHMQAPHLAAYLAATEGAVRQFTIHEMTRIA